MLLRYAIGELDHEEMMNALEHWDYTFDSPPADDPNAYAYVRSTWDQWRLLTQRVDTSHGL